MYVDEIPDVKYGSYIRWIPLKNPDNLKLTNGGLVTGIDVCVTGTVLTCKNHLNRFFRVKMDEAMIFKRQQPRTCYIRVLKYLLERFPNNILKLSRISSKLRVIQELTPSKISSLSPLSPLTTIEFILFIP